jgi:AcrR family transcriptional regulator
MPSDLKTKTAELRRQHVLDAAIRVFDAHGFRGATIKHVAVEAGVSDGTIYNVFESKEALLLAILEPLLRSSLPPQGLPPPEPGTDPAKFLPKMISERWASLTPEVLAMMRIVWSEALTNRDLAKLYRDRITTPALETPAALLKGLSDAGAISTKDVPATMKIIVASYLGLVLLRLLGDDDPKLASGEVARHLSDLLLHGLVPRSPSGDDHGSL